MHQPPGLSEEGFTPENYCLSQSVQPGSYSIAADAHIDGFCQHLGKLSRQGHTEVLGQCSKSGCAAPSDGYIRVVQAAQVLLCGALQSCGAAVWLIGQQEGLEGS